MYVHYSTTYLESVGLRGTGMHKLCALVHTKVDLHFMVTIFNIVTPVFDTLIESLKHNSTTHQLSNIRKNF